MMSRKKMALASTGVIGASVVAASKLMGHKKGGSSSASRGLTSQNRSL